MTDLSRIDLEAAVLRLRDGGVVAYPTETCYGLGVRADRPDAVDRVKILKGRPDNFPISVLIGDGDWLPDLGAIICQEEQKIMDAFWPGPLTLLLQVSGDSSLQHLAAPLLGVRCSDHPVCRQLVSMLGIPITATSANRHGQPEFSSPVSVSQAFSGEDLLVLDDPLLKSKPDVSTVVKIEKGIPVILREGRLSLAQITKVLSQ